MKFFKSFTAVALVASLFSSPASGYVELNGIACFSGKRYALFEVSQSVAATHALTLAEGETQAGITLLSVNAAAGRVEIEYGGVHERLRIGSANSGPLDGLATLVREVRNRSERLTRPANSLTEAQQDLAEQYQIMAGNPGFGTIPLAENSPAKTVEKISDPASAEPVKATTDETKQYWYQESQRIEARRIASEAAVLAGDVLPQPRTPLTPPGTPAQLVSREIYFGNHIPGFIVPGFLD